jgi:DNA-binding response OmpR family regulator
VQLWRPVLLQLLASQASKPPVIMITARAERELEAKATAAGAVCLLRNHLNRVH